MNTNNKDVESITNERITIYPVYKNNRGRRIYCKGDWFNDAEYFELIEEDYFLLIRKCFLEIPEKAVKMQKGKSFSITCNLPIGKFIANNEDSNEDELVIYYD